MSVFVRPLVDSSARTRVRVYVCGYRYATQPGNLLVSFNRLGKRRTCETSNFRLAQLVVADFGVSRVFKSNDSTDATGGMTATVTMSGMTAHQGICGTEM